MVIQQAAQSGPSGRIDHERAFCGLAPFFARVEKFDEYPTCLWVASRLKVI